MLPILESFRYTFVNQNSLPSEFACTFRFGKRDIIDSKRKLPDYESQVIKVKEFLIVYAEFLQIHNLEITAIYESRESSWFFQIEYIGFRRYALGITLSVIEVEMRSSNELRILAESYAGRSVFQFRQAMADYPQQWTLDTSTKQLLVQNPCARIVLRIEEIRFIESINPRFLHHSFELILCHNRCLNILSEKLWYERLLPLQCSRLHGFQFQHGYFYVIQPNAREIVRDGTKYIIDTQSEEYGVPNNTRNLYGDIPNGAIRNNFFGRLLDRLSHTPTYQSKPKHIGDITCTNNARSEFLRCAINPCGPCKGCKHYTNDK